MFEEFVGIGESEKVIEKVAQETEENQIEIVIRSQVDTEVDFEFLKEMAGSFSLKHIVRRKWSEIGMKY